MGHGIASRDRWRSRASRARQFNSRTGNRPTRTAPGTAPPRPPPRSPASSQELRRRSAARRRVGARPERQPVGPRRSAPASSGRFSASSRGARRASPAPATNGLFIRNSACGATVLAFAPAGRPCSGRRSRTTSNISGSALRNTGRYTLRRVVGRACSRSRRRASPGTSARRDRRSSLPLTASIVSRMHSASSRRRFARPKQAVLRVGATGLRRRPSRPADRSGDSTIRRTSFFTDQPSSTNRVARWSSSSGCDGRLAGGAEVVDGADDAGAEQPVPDAVDDRRGPSAGCPSTRASRPAASRPLCPSASPAAVPTVATREEAARGRSRRGCGRCRGRGPGVLDLRFSSMTDIAIGRFGAVDEL